MAESLEQFAAQWDARILPTGRFRSLRFAGDQIYLRDRLVARRSMQRDVLTQRWLLYRDSRTLRNLENVLGRLGYQVFSVPAISDDSLESTHFNLRWYFREQDIFLTEMCQCRRPEGITYWQNRMISGMGEATRYIIHTQMVEALGQARKIRETANG